MHADAGAHRPARWLAAAVIAGAGALTAGLALYWRTSSTTTPTITAPLATASADDRVAQTLRLGRPTVVEFGSTSCVSCREMKPLLAQLAREQGDRVAVGDIDVLKEREYLGRYKIMVMPTQVFFDAQGRETSRHIGKISVADMQARLGLADAEPAR